MSLLRAALLVAWFAASPVWAVTVTPPRIDHDVPYSGKDSKLHSADIVVPAGVAPFPVVLLIHGGGWTRGDKRIMSGLAYGLAARGFASVSISYRLAPVFVHPAQLEDCRAALRWIRANAGEYGFDANRIGGWGHSAGGHLVALLATTGNEARGERLTAAVLASAPTDLAAIASQGTPIIGALVRQYLGVAPDLMPDAYRDASPISHVDAGDPPMFIYHGRLDDLVPFSQAERMKEALDRAKVAAELRLIDDAGHTEVTPGQKVAYGEAIDFLDRELKKPRPAATPR